MYPGELRYARTHEWARVEGNKAAVGITDYAVKELSDIVYIELPKVGDRVKQNSPFAAIESVKAAFELNSPLSGEVIEVNGSLSENLELLTKDTYGEGWMIKLRMENKGEVENLMDAEGYEKYLKEEKD